MSDATEQETKDCLWRAFVRDRADYILVDGHTLVRQKFLRAATTRAVDAGWLDLGELIENKTEQWSHYKARLTEAGRAMLAAHQPVER